MGRNRDFRLRELIYIIFFYLISILLTNNKIEASKDKFPVDFYHTFSKKFSLPEGFKWGAGGGIVREERRDVKHYPVIMLHENARDYTDWLGYNRGNLPETETPNVYEKFIKAGFHPIELWMFQYTHKSIQMRNIEELTDKLKNFIYAVLYYTGARKIQILAHGEGAPLAMATLKKYELYNLIYSAVLIAGPLHGSGFYNYTRCLQGYPVHCNLAPNSDFLFDLNIPDESPYNIFENEDGKNFAIKYMTIRNGQQKGDIFFKGSEDSPKLLGAINVDIEHLDHDGLRVSDSSSNEFIPFLSDETEPYDSGLDRDADGFMSEESGGNDCDDNAPNIFPGAEEICDDNIDQDCNYRDRIHGDGKDIEVPLK